LKRERKGKKLVRSYISRREVGWEIFGSPGEGGIAPLTKQRAGDPGKGICQGSVKEERRKLVDPLTSETGRSYAWRRGGMTARRSTHAPIKEFFHGDPLKKKGVRQALMLRRR